MTGTKSYSTTASENVSANTGINWDEGMRPATVNNSARANMADLRSTLNDGPWFEYGVGSKTVAHVYASGTSTTLASATDATAYWHVGRRVRAVGASTGTIYGKVASSAFAASTTTVTYTWDSGSLSNETLAVSAGLPVTGQPVSLVGGGTVAVGADSGTTTCAASSTVNINVPASTAGILFINETSPIGSSSLLIPYDNLGGFVGVGTVSTATSSGTTAMASIAGNAGGGYITFTAKSTGGTVNITYTILRTPR